MHQEKQTPRRKTNSRIHFNGRKKLEKNLKLTREVIRGSSQIITT